MPRVGRIPRPRLAQQHRATVEEMHKRYDAWDALYWATVPEHFFVELPTPAERQAFALAFPKDFYSLFGFISHDSDNWPTSTMYDLRGIFRRPAEEFFALLASHPPRVAFDAPNVWGLPYREQRAALATARGRWWRLNGWPMTAREIVWLEANDEHERFYT